MYTFHSRIRYSEVNDKCQLTLSNIANYFQDCTTFHSEDLGVGVEDSITKKRAWILNSWQIIVNRYPVFGEEVEVRAKIMNLRGLSGHADKNKLTEWICHFEQKPKRVFVVHGDDAVAESFTNHLKGLQFNAYAPYSGDGFDLLTGQQVLIGSRALVEKKVTKVKNTVFARLLAAGERLLTVIRRCEGMANKDLAKFADQINALSDKWER